MAANGGANTHHPAQRPRDKAQLTPKPTLVPPPATPQTARKGRLNFLYSTAGYPADCPKRAFEFPILYSYNDSNPVGPFWEKMGFKATGETKPYKGKARNSTVLLMEKSLRT